MSATTGTDTTTAVERYLACMAAHDWDGLAATIADEGLVRDGPFCDVVEGKQGGERWASSAPAGSPPR